MNQTQLRLATAGDEILFATGAGPKGSASATKPHSRAYYLARRNGENEKSTQQRTTASTSCRGVRISENSTAVGSGVARICYEEGQRLKLCHGALTVDFWAGCSSCSMTNSFVTNAVLIERAVSC